MWGDSGEAVETRVLIFGVMAFANKTGLLLFYLVPFLPLFITTEMTPETLKISFFIAVILTLPALYVALRYVPNGPHIRVSNVEKIRNPSVYFNKLVSSIKRNKPFQIFVAAYMCVGLGIGMYYGI